MLGTEPPVSPNTDDARILAATGIDLCRSGDWKRGAFFLECAAKRPTNGVPLPALYHSYHGHAVAREGRRVQEGLAFCEQAAREEFWDPEIWLNLAKVRLHAGNRRGALSAVNEGLAIDPTQAGLLGIFRDLGVRRPPVISFLSRTNPLNQLLGRARYRLAQASRA